MFSLTNLRNLVTSKETFCIVNVSGGNYKIGEEAFTSVENTITITFDGTDATVGDGTTACTFTKDTKSLEIMSVSFTVLYSVFVYYS